MTDTELKPCPFCGADAEIRAHPNVIFDETLRGWEVGCSLCSARVGRAICRDGKTKAEAIAAWNRRAK